MFSTCSFAQASEETRARFRKMSEESERRGLAEPFKGITINGNVVDGLFPIKPTGVSTAPARQAAEKFLASLTAEQRGKVLFPIDDAEWRKWMNQHFYQRQGVSFQEMTPPQREAAFGFMDASLSPKGMRLTRDIMRLNETLAELTGDHEFFGEWLYFSTIMGKPSASAPWGWQFDGHHGIINYFALGDQVVMTPHFAGSEPMIAGLYIGNMDEGHAKVKMDEVKRHLDATYFAWIGGTDAASVFLLSHPQPHRAHRIRPPAPPRIARSRLKLSDA
jgi:hypothetical protein